MDQEPYSKTRAYREKKEELSGYEQQRYDAFLADFELQLRSMFGSLNPSTVTEEERTDIKNFARFALKRLMASAAYSKWHKRYGLQAATRYAVRKGDEGHDVMHAAIAGIRSQGKTFVPEYAREPEHRESDRRHMNIASDEESYTQFFSSIDHLQWNLTILLENEMIFESKTKDLDPAIVSELQELKKSNPARYCVRAWQELYRREPLPAALAEYVEHLYAAMQKGTVDPKFPLNEFRRIFKDLLNRLKAGTVS